MSAMANLPSPSSELERFRRQLRAYELSLDRGKRKRLGQFFSGPRASSMLAALSVPSDAHKIADPMAGHGDLLDAVAMRSAALGRRVSLTGVEIDGPTAKLAARRLDLCAGADGHIVEVLHADAFTPDLWREDRAVGSFDLVITNPPYVRYQAHSATKSRAVTGTTATGARSAVLDLAQATPDRAEALAWSALIEGYSGLADLSVPSWLLCALLVKPGGTLALVAPKTWMNRDYATVIQYLQLRFFEPLVIVEEHGVGWFEDALVPATLVVSRRLSSQDASIPLSERDENQRFTTIAAIRPAAADSRSLVGCAFPSSDPDAAFVAWLGTATASLDDQIAVRHLAWAEQRRALFARCGHKQWFRAAGETVRVHHPQRAVPHSPLPPALHAVIGSFRPTALTTFDRLGYRVGQGLRTGCNPFFYLDAIGAAADGIQAARISDPLGGGVIRAPAELLRPVVRRQSDVPGFALDRTTLTGRVLVLRDWALPEDADATCLRPVPDSLASFIRRASRTSIGPPQRRVRIPELSAVRTNGRAGTRATLFPDISAPRYWYMLPDFAERHRPLLFVARVNSSAPSFIVNSDPPTLIDANFSTIYGHSESMPPLALMALLNSTWCRACAECIGTPMGGGALKLEATQLRKLPLPVLTPDAMSRLAEIGRSLSRSTAARAEDLVPTIDDVVLHSLVTAPQDVEATCSRLLAFIAERREQRTRAPKEAML